jgi:thymidylate synthase
MEEHQVVGDNSRLNYVALYQRHQLISGQGQTGVITGWTVKQAIAKHLQPPEYAVIGQLYSPTRGINLLIRNLLWNPHVRYLVILNGTREDKNAGGCQCLLDFFHHGVESGLTTTGRQSWVIRSSILGYLDFDIDFQSLEKLRDSLEVVESRSIPETLKLVQTYSQKKIAPWGFPQEFPMSAIEPRVLPGQRYGHRVEGKTIAETWVKIIQRIQTTGTIRPTSYDGKWQELIDLIAVVTDEPADFYFPEPNYLPIDRSFLAEYISQILDDAPEQEGLKYTYGQRLRSWFGRDQIQVVIDKLTADIDSARAVMSLWDPTTDNQEHPPCLNHIWVRIIDAQLSLTATFRSNDMFSAWTANAMGLRALQKYIFNAVSEKTALPLKMGPLITLSQSAHIYDDCWENASKVIETEYSRICQRRNYADPGGSFVITLQEHNLVVEHMTPGSGEIVNYYTGKSATQLARKIVADCPGLEVEHAIYLGLELQKAEMALSTGAFFYQQDQPLRKV